MEVCDVPEACQAPEEMRIWQTSTCVVRRPRFRRCMTCIPRFSLLSRSSCRCWFPSPLLGGGVFTD